MEIATYFLDGTCYSKTYDNPENESLCETIQSYMYEKCVPPTVEVHFQVNPIHFYMKGFAGGFVKIEAQANLDMANNSGAPTARRATKWSPIPI